MSNPPFKEGEHWHHGFVDEAARRHLDPGLVAIIALDAPPPRVVPIGTGFIVEAAGASALVCTAAHNFEPGIRHVQQPRACHHPTTPREFLPEPRALDLGKLKVRALVSKGDSVEHAVLNWVVVDETVDLAFFSISSESGDPHCFQHRMMPLGVAPPVGGDVCVLGLTCEIQQATPPWFTIKRTMHLRRGRVVEHHDRYFGCDGPCIETSVPVFPGMSGGPVFALPEVGGSIQPFGFVSSDPDGTDKNDPRVAGSSIAPVIAQSVTTLADGQQQAIVNMRNARFTHRT